MEHSTGMLNVASWETLEAGPYSTENQRGGLHRFKFNLNSSFQNGWNKEAEMDDGRKQNAGQ